MGLAPAMMRWLPDGWRRGDAPTRQVDINPTRVFFGRKVKAHLSTDLLDAGLELLHSAGRVVALAHNDVQMRLAAGAGVADSGLENILGLLYILPVQVDGIGRYPARRVVLAEDEL